MIYFFEECGRITRRASIPFSDAEFMAVPGEQWIQSDEVVSDDTHYILNGAIVPFPALPGEGWVWDWIEVEWRFPASALKDLKATKKANIEVERNKRRDEGVNYRGVRFDSDAVSAGNLTGWTTAIAVGIPVPEGFTWRSKDNQDVPFTSEDIVGLSSVMIGKTTACYQRSWSLKAELDELTDYQQVKDFDITTGWPE